jgi:hypothetical protein
MYFFVAREEAERQWIGYNVWDLWRIRFRVGPAAHCEIVNPDAGWLVPYQTFVQRHRRNDGERWAGAAYRTADVTKSVGWPGPDVIDGCGRG